MVWYLFEGGLMGERIQNGVGVLFIGTANVNVLWVEGQRQIKRRK